MKIRSIAAALLLCAACVEEGSDSDQVDETAVDPDKAQDPETIAERDTHQFSMEPTCDIAPDPDEPGGPCAHACDQAALQQFVPEGACFTFLCERSDGSPVKVGACNP